MDRQDFTYGYYLENNFIGIREDGLRGLAPLSSLQAKLLLAPLTYIKHTEQCNSPEVEVPKTDLKRVLKLPKSCDDRSNYLKWLKRNYSELMEVATINGEPVLEEVRSEYGNIIITYSCEAMEYFEGLGWDYSCQRYHRIWVNDLYDLEDIHSWNWRRMLMLYGDTSKISQHFFTTKQIKEFLGLTIDSYMRKTGGFDRTNFEKKCITKPLEDLSKNEQIRIIPYISNEFKTVIYRKVKDGTSNYDGVRGYEFRYKVSDHIKNKNKIKEDKKYGYMQEQQGDWEDTETQD